MGILSGKGGKKLMAGTELRVSSGPLPLEVFHELHVVHNAPGIPVLWRRSRRIVTEFDELFSLQLNQAIDFLGIRHVAVEIVFGELENSLATIGIGADKGAMIEQEPHCIEVTRFHGTV